MIDKARVLIAPLDWGLGHASRCIPLIRQLLSHNYEVLIAAEGSVQILLQQEFPGIQCLPLHGYNIRYGKTRMGLAFGMLVQIPKILASISAEKKWLEETIKKNNIAIVISDNRYGLHSKKAFSVFITHQLSIQTPFFSSLLQKINYRFINRFHECWVPDFEGIPNVAGSLSHPKKLPSPPVKYIGCLSRFEPLRSGEEKHILILLSGPEPQRTILEKKIVTQLNNFSDPVILVRGLPGSNDSLQVKSNVQCFNHLSASQLQEAIGSASYVIARSGYSTIMDLVKLKKKSILVPTPGQTEQEYLAQYLGSQHLALTVPQKLFEIKKALAEASTFPYQFFSREDNLNIKSLLKFRESLAALPDNNRL